MNEEKIEKRNNMFHSPFYNVFLLVSEHANTGDKKALAYISSFYNWEVLKEVVKWMTELAEQGDMDAQYNLGIHYQQMLDGNDKIFPFSFFKISHLSPANLIVEYIIKISS